jgi:murein L,D-transpeptidase YafK
MLNKNIGFMISLQLKNLQFRLKTWRQSREIAHAYGDKPRVSPRKTGQRFLLAIFLLITITAVVYLSALYGKHVSTTLIKMVHSFQVGITTHKTAPKKPSPESMIQSPAPPIIAQDSMIKKPVAPPEPHLAEALKKPEADSTKVVPAAFAEQPSVRTAIKAPGDSGFFPMTLTYSILVNKADRTLYLFGKLDNGKDFWKNLERFSILVGRNDGQKMTAGDERTPEGTYFIVGRKETEELNAIYGPLAYMLNYPNEEDRRAGRTGQGIWIHGTREDTSREATRGCVVLNNNDILTLAKYLQLGIGTPVVIVNAVGLTTPEQAMNYAQLRNLRERILTEYNGRRIEFETLLSQWKQAWESRDIDSYSRFYDPDRFFGEGLRWGAWRDKKQRTFHEYNSIAIGLEKICVSEFSESTAVILFMQRYESNLYKVQRPKKLSFFKSDGKWRIFKEETFSRQELLL